MKRIALLGLMIVLGYFARAQAYEGKAEHQRKAHTAAVMELPYPPDMAEEAIVEYMAQKGYKLSSSKGGLMTFKGVKLNSYNTDNNDIHFKVERKSRKEKDASIVQLIVTKENESLASRIADDRAGIEDAKSFLTGMAPHFESHHLEKSIVEQDNSVKKAEKKMDDLVEEQQDLEKKIKNLQEKLAKNKKDQETQKTEIGNQKTILETLKGKRKS